MGASQDVYRTPAAERSVTDFKEGLSREMPEGRIRYTEPPPRVSGAGALDCLGFGFAASVHRQQRPVVCSTSLPC